MRSILAFEMVTCMCLMSAFRIEVKEPLYSAVLLGLGFYFGQKTTHLTGGQNEKVARSPDGPAS